LLPSAKQKTLSFHAELYKMIPQDHQLRKFHEVIDFSFIHELVRSSYCEYYGRPANEPELLFRLLFLQVLYNLSDERIIEEAQVNLAYKWFLGLNPEDPLPDPSQLSRFRNHRLGASAVNEVLKAVVRQCIDKGLIKSKTIIIDSTHTLAASQKQLPFKVLRDAEAPLPCCGKKAFAARKETSEATRTKEGPSRCGEGHAALLGKTWGDCRNAATGS